jgi:putative SOS response-associated peptidase YedK
LASIAAEPWKLAAPASGFYEWSEGEKGAGLPWYVSRADGLPTVLAGIWQRWQDMDTVAIVSTEAGPGMAGIHHREPVVLERENWTLWLGKVGHGAAVLMKPSAEGVMSPPYRVGVAVNSNRAAGSALIEPVAA